MRSQNSHFSAAVAIAPQTATAAVTGTTVDRKGYDSVTFVGIAGTYTGSAPDGLTIALQHSDDDSSWSTPDSADVLGDLAITTGDTSRTGYVGGKRYVRANLTVPSGCSAPIAITAVLGNPARQPAA